MKDDRANHTEHTRRLQDLWPTSALLLFKLCSWSNLEAFPGFLKEEICKGEGSCLGQPAVFVFHNVRYALGVCNNWQEFLT